MSEPAASIAAKQLPGTGLCRQLPKGPGNPNRGPEAVAYMQRVLQRYPYETEVKAFGVALYSALGSPQEARLEGLKGFRIFKQKR